MGKSKKGYNWRARSQLPGNVDLSQARALEGKILENGDNRTTTGGGYEGSNALIMPSEGNKFTKDRNLPVVGKILSRKQRKRLEQIVDKKKKKENRAELLAALQSVQTESLDGYESLASVQTKGVKKQLVESKEELVLVKTADLSPSRDSLSDKLARKRKRQTAPQEKVKTARRSDVVGFESSSSEEEEEVEEESSDEDSDVEKNINDDQDQDEEKKSKQEEEIKFTVGEAKEERVNTKARDEDEVEDEVATSHKPSNLKTLTVSRAAEVEEGRSKLPILGQEQEIMELINNHGVVVLSGETGCGKTTQLPQFLYEAGYTSHARIGVTQPRRVAATAMANRVAQELGVSGDIVSYQIRYEGNVTDKTKIKFMTDGVLLREIERDFLLSSYSVIIIDEAHERSVFTDILIGLLSRIVPLRLKKSPESPLKVIIMSATLRVEDFTANIKLFRRPPPVISVDSRQFPVTVHFNKKTNPDYISDAFKKVCKIHSGLPEGGILVFVTGQQEVNILIRKLRAKFPGKHYSKTEEEQLERIITSHKKSKKKSFLKEKKVSTLVPDIDLSNYNPQPLDDTETDVLRGDQEDEEDDDLDLDDDEENVGVSGLCEPLYVLPLYSLLSSERQQMIWAGPPPGARLCVVATNIAETSLTIPGVKYVVDTGKVKVKHYDKVTGVSTFLVEWISQAQANQRAGRAGRQGPGHCYRLYSSAVFSDLAQFSKPEIMSRPVEDLLLQMKTMNIDKVVNFPFPTCPDTDQLRSAELKLQQLGALQSPPQNIPIRELEKIQFCSSVTALGKVITNFPVSPRFGKMLALAHQHNLLPLTLSLVAALTVQEVTMETELPSAGAEQERKLPGRLRQLRREWAGTGNCLQLGDPMVLLQACISAESQGYCQDWCARSGLRVKAMQEIRRLRRQLAQEVSKILPGEQETLQLGMKPPDQTQARLLQQLLLAGSPFMVARKISEEEEKSDPRHKGGYRTGAMEQMVFIHSSSVLKQAAPDWVVYQDLFETRDKIVMRGVTAISASWLPLFCPSQVRLGEPLTEPGPSYSLQDLTVRASYQGTFGALTWQLPITEQEMPPSLEKYKWFGRFFLEGAVAPELTKYKSSLLSNPLIMKRTEILLKDLAKENCDGGKKLKKIWSRDSKYLLSSYLAWLPEVVHEDVTKLWPPSIQQ